MRIDLCSMLQRAALACLLLCAPTMAPTDEHQEEQTALDSTALNDDVIVLIGASYARSWPVVSLGGKRVVNRGISGNQTFEMLARFEDDVLAVEPEQVIIWGFINNIFRSEPDDLERALERVHENFESMYSLATDHGIDVVLATEVTIREPRGLVNLLAGITGRLLGKTSYQSYINRHVTETNRRLREFAARHEVTILDFEALLSGGQTQRHSAYAADDGSHLSEAAYDALTRYTNEQLVIGQEL